MEKQELIEQANSNIEKLIDALIDKEYDAMRMYCIDPSKQRSEACDLDCDKCQKEFFDRRRKMLRDMYYLEA